jgi:hypothetical protein
MSSVSFLIEKSYYSSDMSLASEEHSSNYENGDYSEVLKENSAIRQQSLDRKSQLIKKIGSCRTAKDRYSVDEDVIDLPFQDFSKGFAKKLNSQLEAPGKVVSKVSAVNEHRFRLEMVEAVKPTPKGAEKGLSISHLFNKQSPGSDKENVSLLEKSGKFEYELNTARHDLEACLKKLTQANSVIKSKDLEVKQLKTLLMEERASRQEEAGELVTKYEHMLSQVRSEFQEAANCYDAMVSRLKADCEKQQLQIEDLSSKQQSADRTLVSRPHESNMKRPSKLHKKLETPRSKAEQCLDNEITRTAEKIKEIEVQLIKSKKPGGPPKQPIRVPRPRFQSDPNLAPTVKQHPKQTEVTANKAKAVKAKKFKRKRTYSADPRSRCRMAT